MVVPGSARSRAPLFVAAIILITVCYLVMLATKPGGINFVVRLSDAATTAAAAAASVACALAGRRDARSMRAFWWLLAAACGAWASGEAIWTWYEVVLRLPVPYPSWADVGYLAGTPLAVAAFACHPAAHRRHRLRVIPLLDGVAVANALLFVSWLLVLGPLWESNGGISLGDLVAVAYPFGDVVILVLVILALRNLQPGNRPATAMLLGGLLVQRSQGSAAHHRPGAGRPRADPYLPSATGASKHQATALPPGQGVGRAAAFQDVVTLSSANENPPGGPEDHPHRR
jgi:diguanylate cyclase